MALILKDRVKETTTTSGTGTVTLAGVTSGFQSFSVVGDGNTTYYAIENGNNWEVGVGTYTASGTTLSRDTILESSNAGSAISLSGTSTVFCTYPAERSVNTEDIGVSIEAYDADTAKYDDTTANFTGTLQNGGSNVVVDTDIGSTVEAYNSNLAGINQALTTTSSPTFATLNATNAYATNIGLDSTDYLKFTNNTQMDIYVNGSNEFRFESDGDFHADGDVIAYSTTTASDEKLKDNIEVVDNAVDKLNQLKGVTFNWKRDNQASAGVIAQDVQKVLPQAVKEITDMKGDTHLTVNYAALTSILIEAVKDLSEQVNELRNK
jgi:hypothetical protein